ncbi:MAG: MBL fold metallo-hydrolase [Actinomycetota bacterium]
MFGTARLIVTADILIGSGRQLGGRTRLSGTRPADVRRVLLTHLHPDHVGGVDAFAGPRSGSIAGNSSVRPRLAAGPFTGQPLALVRTGPFDLDPEPYGPFPQSKALTANGDVRLVPIPGHAMGQVGVVVETEPARLFFHRRSHDEPGMVHRIRISRSGRNGVACRVEATRGRNQPPNPRLRRQRTDCPGPVSRSRSSRATRADGADRVLEDPAHDGKHAPPMRSHSVLRVDTASPFACSQRCSSCREGGAM